ncbi:hypothetical protein ACPC39_33005 [Streptomyces cellulosae]
MRYLGYGLPAELVALWRLCGGVEHQYIEENEEHGEVGSGAFLPDRVLFTPVEAFGPPVPGDDQGSWEGAQAVPWLTRDEAGPEFGLYVSAAGVGCWSTLGGPVVDEPYYPSMAAYLESVHRALTVGPADLMGSDVPGIVWTAWCGRTRSTRGWTTLSSTGRPSTERSESHPEGWGLRTGPPVG